MTFIEAGRYDQAKSYLKQSAEASSTNSEKARKSLAQTYHMLGTILMEQGEREEALSTFLEGTQIDPDHWQSRFDLGILYFKQGQTAPAREQFIKALKIRPDDADMLNKIGLALFTEGKVEQSVEYYAKALALEPANGVVIRNIGAVLQRIARHEEIIKVLLLAIKIALDVADLHFHLANSYSQLHRSRKALHHFREALRIRPSWALVANNVAWIWRRTRIQIFATALRRYDSPSRLVKQVSTKSPQPLIHWPSPTLLRENSKKRLRRLV